MVSDLFVNDIWAGGALTPPWGTPFWEHSLPDGLQLQWLAVETHVVTSWHFAPPLVKAGGLVAEITDGTDPGYRGNFFYGLAKAQVIRLALAQSADFAPYAVTAISRSGKPGQPGQAPGHAQAATCGTN